MKEWKRLHYIQKGISHIQNKTNCQDSISLYENEEYIVASLADGIGSLKHSEIAAKSATQTVCNCFSEVTNLLEQFDTIEKIGKYILDAVVMNIQKTAGEMNIPLEEMDCTLVFVCILKKINKAVVGCLGDSVICVLSEPKAFVISNGEMFANGTKAVLDNDAIEHFDINILDMERDNIYGFILSSDGLENELFVKGSDYLYKAAELYFNSLVREEPVSVVKERIDKLTRYVDTSFDDDISVIVLSRSDKEIHLPEDPRWLCTCGFRNRLMDTYCARCHKDFLVLYRNVRFKDCGGKAAFFVKINQNPEEEARIIGLQNITVPLTEEIFSTDMQFETSSSKNDEDKDAINDLVNESMVEIEENTVVLEESDKSEIQNKEKKFVSLNNRKKYIKVGSVLLSIVFILGIFVGGIFVKNSMSSKIKTLMYSIDVLNEQKEHSENELILKEKEFSLREKELESKIPENFYKIEDGNYYWGNLDQSGMPHGTGVLLKGTFYYIGNFNHGKKDGKFSVISSAGKHIIQNYKNDELIRIKSNDEFDNELFYGRY